MALIYTLDINTQGFPQAKDYAPLEPGGFEHAFLSANGAMSLAWSEGPGSISSVIMSSEGAMSKKIKATSTYESDPVKY